MIQSTSAIFACSKKNLRQSSTGFQHFLAHDYSAGSISGHVRFSREFAAQESLPWEFSSSELTKHWVCWKILFYFVFSTVLNLKGKPFGKAVSFKRLQPFGYVILLAWFSHRPQITFLGDTQFIEDIEFWKKITVAFIKVDSFALLCLFFISVRSRMYLNIDSHFELSHSAKHRKKNYSQIERLSHSQLDETTMTTDYVPRIPNYSVSLFERKILVSSSLVFYCFVFVFEIQVIFGTGSFSFLAFSIN